MSDDDVILSVRGVSKRYGLPPLLPWRKRPEGGHYALRDIDFEVRRGESFGILGPNGAGKSTLLKVLAGVTPPDEGEVEVRGRLFPMIELNAGMHMELPGRDNIEVLGAIMGMSATEIREKMPRIEAFSELGEWLDKPLWSYSSGMIARLGFSIAINVDAEILLVDEVLAVGDIAFQKKCMTRIHELAAAGVTILLVSHSPYQVERICDRALLVDHGRMLEIGSAKDVMKRYFAMMDAKIVAAGEGEAKPEAKRRGTGDIRVQRIEILDANGNPTDTVETCSPVTFRLHYVAKEDIRRPNFALRLVDRQNALLMSMSSVADRPELIPQGEHVVDCRVDGIPLTTNKLSLSVKVSNAVVLDAVEDFLRFDIRATEHQSIRTGGVGTAYGESAWDFGSASQAVSSDARRAVGGLS
ncbi:ABC transporter ATP-binding protein [Salinarimonas sp.]|uniref:ABC transporter ATP-binding protein n=1 Tax=Salinarimonas sp. TaxID=2766526 RepID=UPI00391DFC81